MKKERNVNIDLVKCIAVLSVIGIHFFLYSGFYNVEINNGSTILLTIMRMLFLVCVPLFMITTGYLMKNKEVNRAYYFGMLKTYTIYLIITIFIILYSILYLNSKISFVDAIKQILRFDIGYCWYIEMYLGMFIFMPFLNVTYNSLPNKFMKKILILSMMSVTCIPVFINTKIILVPNWWTIIYPITYYFVGCYLREYKVNISWMKSLLFFILFWLLGSALIIWRSYWGKFIRGDEWTSIFTFGMAVSLFILIINLNLEKIYQWIKKVIIKISELSLGIYLASYIADNLLYKNLFKDYNLVDIKYWFIIVPLSFIIAFIISFIANLLYKVIDKFIIEKIKNRVVNNKGLLSKITSKIKQVD